MTPAPEKAAPIPVGVKTEARIAAFMARQAPNAEAAATVIAYAILADREARPSLPDSREERDSPANLAKRVLAMREHLQHEQADGVDLGTLTVVARTLTAVASAERARARQGGNNG